MAHASLRAAFARLRAVTTRFSRRGTETADQIGAARPVDAGRYHAALAALPAETRSMFLLHRVDSLDIASIAERTGYSTTVVEQHIASAIFAIANALDAGEA